MRQTQLKDLFPVTVLHLERCVFLARSNGAKNVECYDSEFKQSSWLFEKEKWRTRICLDVSASTLNAEDEAWTKAFHPHHRVTLTDAHLEGSLSLYFIWLYSFRPWDPHPVGIISPWGNQRIYRWILEAHKNKTCSSNSFKIVFRQDKEVPSSEWMHVCSVVSAILITMTTTLSK